jgi:hypothetical protein
MRKEVHYSLPLTQDECKLLPEQMQVESFAAPFFKWDSGSHHRIIPIFQLTGIDYFSEPNRSEIEKGYSWLSKLNSWPSRNSIRLDSGVIILKFSDPTKEQLQQIVTKNL